MTGILPLLLAVAALPETPPMVQADPATCNSATATRVEFGILIEDEDSWIGRCVAVRGLWAGRAIFAEMRDARRRFAETRDDSRDRRIGIYAPNALAATRRSPPRSYRAVGILLDCQALWADTHAVSGYCHNNSSGPFLAVTEMRPAR